MVVVPRGKLFTQAQAETVICKRVLIACNWNFQHHAISILYIVYFLSKRFIVDNITWLQNECTLVKITTSNLFEYKHKRFHQPVRVNKYPLSSYYSAKRPYYMLLPFTVIGSYTIYILTCANLVYHAIELKIGRKKNYRSYEAPDTPLWTQYVCVTLYLKDFFNVLLCHRQYLTPLFRYIWYSDYASRS